MEDPHHVTQQFYTDAHGVHYSRYGDNSPWHQISPRRHPTQQISQLAVVSQATPSYNFPPLDYGLPPGLNQAPVARDYFQPAPVPIDPGAIPLPDDDDEDFPPPHKLLPRIARPATKAAGSRRADPDPKGKGKQVARDTTATKTSAKRKATSQMGAPETKKPKGRVAGTANYTADDIWGLLAILSERLPIGGRAWNSCADEYNVWAEENDRPTRTSKSLEAKYKQLVKTTKPTGDADMPEYVYQAHEIEDAINEKAGTRDLEDDDIADEVVDASSGDDDDDPPAKPPPSLPKKPTHVKKEQPTDNTGPIARRATSDCITQSRQSRNAAPNLLSTLSEALDPSVQAARQEEQAARTFQTSQLFSLTTQLRESANLVESLRTRLAESDREHNAAERRADKAEMMAMLSGSRAPQLPPPPPALHPPRWANIPSATRTPSRPVRHDVFYSDGGSGVRWVGPNDSPQLYPDSPGTRVFARYTPERVGFTSHHTQYTPADVHSSSRYYLPTPLPSASRHRHSSPTPLPSSSRHQYSPQPLAPSSRRQYSPEPVEPVASSSRHPTCIAEALVSLASSHRGDDASDVFANEE